MGQLTEVRLIRKHQKSLKLLDLQNEWNNTLELEVEFPSKSGSYVQM